MLRICRIGFFRLDENMVEIHVDSSCRIWTVPSSCWVSSEGHWALGWCWIWTHCPTKTCIPCLHGRVPLWHVRLCGSSVSGLQVIPAGGTRFCWHLPRSHRRGGTRQTWLTLPRPTGSRCRWSCGHQECRWWLCQVKAHKKPCLRNKFLRKEWFFKFYVYFAICQIFFIWVFNSSKVSEFPDICKHWIIYCYSMTCFLVKL